MDWTGLNVLVTGGTGSFGRKFTEIMLREFTPRKLVIFSRDELKQHEMRTGGFDHPSLRYFIGDVRDVERLRRAMTGMVKASCVHLVLFEFIAAEDDELAGREFPNHDLGELPAERACATCHQYIQSCPIHGALQCG